MTRYWEEEPRSVYIHVPFCRHRCGYCDFTLVAKRDDLIEPYLDGLDRELALLDKEYDVETLFFGGGTPTHLNSDQLQRLFNIVYQHFNLKDDAEVSIEANPSGLDDEQIDVLHAQGVNRISLGVQSFDERELAILERDHSADVVADVVCRLKKHFQNFSFDLIFGVPGQTQADWRSTLQQAIEFEPTHISTYCLTIEKGTSFWSRHSKGELHTAGDEVEHQMYNDAMTLLESSGYQQYEISSFARSGFECLHNQVYWLGKPYLAFGPGASRFVNGVRTTNHRSVSTWLKRLRQNESPIQDVDELTREDRARELLAIGLRRCSGVRLSDFKVNTGVSIHDIAADAIQSNCESGNLVTEDDTLKLTRNGRFFADSVFGEILLPIASQMNDVGLVGQ